MDFSSLAGTQQQQQQQQQQEQQQPYYPAQAHAYEAYYGFHQPHYDTSASHHQHYYPYDYAATYQQQRHPVAALLDPSSAPAAHPGAPQGAQHQQGAGAPALPRYAQDDQESYSMPPGLNPAAAATVASLSHLSQFAGTMDAAERAMAGMQGRQWRVGQMVAPPHQTYHYPTQHCGAGVRAPYKVDGRRGGGPFRGGLNGVRANLGHYSQGPDGGAPLFRGRGRGKGRGAHMGRGRGRQFPQSTKTSALELESAQTQVSGPAPVLARQPHLPVAWCDICRVDCNSLEILEQHKNGKRHKKTVKIFEEIQAHQKLSAETQAQATKQGLNETTTKPQLTAESEEEVVKHPEPIVQVAEEDRVVQVGEEMRTSTVSEKLQETSAYENTTKTELQGQVGDEEKVSAEAEGIIYLPPVEGPTRGHPPKRRMMRFNKDAKRFRYFRSTESRPKERPKEQPSICTLCNVMCETQVVFDSHIAGKKHTSRVKRFQGKAVYGLLDVYTPPNQPSIYNPSGLQPLFYGLKTQETARVVAQEPFPLVEAYGSYQPEQVKPAVSVLQMKEVGGTHGREGLGTKCQAIVTMEAKGQSAVTGSGVEGALSTQSAQPCSTVMETESFCTSVKDVVVSGTYLTAVNDAMDLGPDATATEPTVTTTEHLAAKADVPVITTESVAVEVEAACKLIEHVTAEAETASEIEEDGKAETSFEMKGN